MPDGAVTALAVGVGEGDYTCLHRIFKRSNWRVFRARNVRQAVRLLRRHPVGVVLAQSNLPDGRWQHLLRLMRNLAGSPLLIVISDGTDVNLWAEALNRGAYDLLSMPFDRAEVTRVISLAWLHWKEAR